MLVLAKESDEGNIRTLVSFLEEVAESKTDIILNLLT